MLLLILTRFVRCYKEFFRKYSSSGYSQAGDLLESVKKISIAQGFILCYHFNIIAKNVCS